jgi:hypothetical protein
LPHPHDPPACTATSSSCSSSVRALHRALHPCRSSSSSDSSTERCCSPSAPLPPPSPCAPHTLLWQRSPRTS